MYFTTLLVSVRANLSGGKFVLVRFEYFFCNSAIAIIKDELRKPVQGEHFQLLGEDALLHADPQPEQVLHLLKIIILSEQIC